MQKKTKKEKPAGRRAIRKMKRFYVNIWGQLGTKKDIMSQGGDINEFKVIPPKELKKYNITKRQWANTLDSLYIDYPECQKLWLSL